VIRGGLKVVGSLSVGLDGGDDEQPNGDNIESIFHNAGESTKAERHLQLSA
jgi:hypothetical protein